MRVVYNVPCPSAVAIQRVERSCYTPTDIVDSTGTRIQPGMNAVL